MKKEIRLLLVDDSAESRRFNKERLNFENLNIVGEATLGNEAFTACQDLKPDAILLTMEEPLTRALRAAETLALNFPNTPMIAISSLGGRDHLRKAMLAGAKEY